MRTETTAGLLAPGPHEVVVDGLTQRYHVHGSGPICLAIPGGPGVAWDSLRAPALEASLTMVYVEPLGTGGSQRLASHPHGYTRERYTRSLLGLLDRLALPQVFLLGHSHGGFVSQHFALHHPDRLHGLVLYDSAPVTGPEHGAEAAARVGEFVQRHQGQAELPAALAALQDVGACTDDETITAALRGLVPLYFARYWDREDEFRHFRETLTCTYVSSLDENGEPDLVDDRAHLPELTVPTLVVVGRHDIICGPRWARELHALIPGSQLVVLEDSGHLGHVEEPEAFASAVRTFVASAQTSAQASTRAGAELRTVDAVPEDLRDVVGPVLLPGMDGYAAECATFNLNHAFQPAIVVAAACEADVRKAVRFAAGQGMPIAVKSAGHQFVGSAEGALLITTERMKRMSVDPEARTVRAEAGLRWSEVLPHTARVGLTPIAGSAPEVGVVGYTLGGGHSPLLGRSHGYAADHVRRMNVVTADGELRTVTPDNEPDLFWALLGGKGNFGVVTETEFDVFPVARFYGGGLYFSGEDLAPVLETWRSWVPTVPEEMTSSLAVQRLPYLPALPPPLRGAFVVHVRIGYLGSQDDAERLIAPLRASAPVLLDAVGEKPITSLGEIHSDPVDPMPYVERSVSLREFPRKAAEVLVDLIGPGSGSGLAHFEIRSLGGALDREPRVANAVSVRGIPFVVVGFAVGGAHQADELREHLAEVVDGLAPWTADRSMVNFLSADEARDEEGVRAAFGPERYRRLAEVKRRYDPANLFRFQHNILPA
ncbi:alpha/beta fold hydrolase [Streptomyces nigra]